MRHIKPIFLFGLGKRVIFSVALLFLVGCFANKASPPAATAPAPAYDENSWRQMIDKTCTVYFDGCNQCRRSPGQEVAACTKKACFVYQKPECLQYAERENKNQSQVYQCGGDRHFEVYRGQYTVDDQMTRLQDNEIILKDPLKHVVYQLQRSASASGERYTDGVTEFWSRGQQALVQLTATSPRFNCLLVTTE